MDKISGGFKHEILHLTRSYSSHHISMVTPHLKNIVDTFQLVATHADARFDGSLELLAAAPLLFWAPIDDISNILQDFIGWVKLCNK